MIRQNIISAFHMIYCEETVQLYFVFRLCIMYIHIYVISIEI